MHSACLEICLHSLALRQSRTGRHFRRTWLRYLCSLRTHHCEARNDAEVARDMTLWLVHILQGHDCWVFLFQSIATGESRRTGACKIRHAQR
ncbi:hypothetical protein BOTBODRAFT_588576 [Botryobasidium botryosum FD-172 SS1]|uniref:Uncharacterized protein n=1 Tax=Botryobasidium botryosum (strain FD-172 SS1) TaxID=930990 RepID=A0A067LZV4_BOTB1|nr:hypothetical protein BOTBODRAFT_588576 [Botryobasidium botryosum FD-172 SS1]